MTDQVLFVVAGVLLLNLAFGLIRIVRGPTAADSMLASQLFGTTGVGILLLLSAAGDWPVLRDVALVFGLLTALAAIAFVKRGAHK